MSEIQPAMTAEQWAMALACPPGVIYGFNQRDEGVMLTHRMAAMCLYGQPFGFTQEDVELLRDWRNGAIGPGHAEWNRSLIDRIAALLPPEKGY